MGSFLRRTIPSAALLVLGLVALLVVGVGGMTLARAGSGGSWSGASGASAQSWGAGAATAGTTVIVTVGDQVMFDSTVNATAELTAGQTTFQVSTPDAAGHTMLLVRLADGVPISRFVADLAIVNSGGTIPADRQQAATNEVDNVGGAMVNAHCTVGFTVTLMPGTYDLIDFKGTGIGDQHPKAQVLHVSGTTGPAAPAATGGQIELTNSSGQPRFVTATRLAADGTFTVTNNSTNTNETAFLPLKPGTTDAALQKFFAGFGGSGASWQSSPFAGGACGLAPINQGHQVVVHISTPPGQYVLASFALDPKTKKREAALGMYQKVNFVPAP